MDPTEDDYAVNKHYCDSNSGKDPSAPGVTGFIGGLIGGAVSGTLSSLLGLGITSTFGNLAGSGLAALGSIAGNVFSSGMRVGSATDWANAKNS